MVVNLSKDYPMRLVHALKVIHSMKEGDRYEFHWGKRVTVEDASNTVVLLLDRGKRKLEISTQKYQEAGFKVFALKVSPNESLDTFELSLTVLSIWKAIFEKISAVDSPSVFTYKYGAKRLRLVQAM